MDNIGVVIQPLHIPATWQGARDGIPYGVFNREVS